MNSKTGQTAIKFSHVSKQYPLYHYISGGFKSFVFNLPKNLRGLKHSSFVALQDINFEIKHGEFVGIMGRNGSGKSTTLGLIAKVLKPTSGSVEVHGRVSPLLELGGGFHPELTGLENIQLNGVLLGLSRKEVSKKINSIIEFSELGEFINQPIRTYSSGMLSRLGFSVVANLDPEILLIDEVLAVGDAKFQQKCIDRVLEFKKRGVTIVLVSHSEDQVKKVCDRVIWIHEHKVKMDGPAEPVLQEYSKLFGHS